MKKLILITALIGNLSYAQSFYDWDNPSKKFDVGGTHNFQLKVVATDNVQQVCDIESKNRGHGGFGYTVNSCAFWNKDMTECTIVTPKRTSMHLLGHELLHCIKGNWH